MMAVCVRPVVSTPVSSVFFFGHFIFLFCFIFLFAYLEHLVCVPDSPSSAVNKQLGSMTLDEQPGASPHLFRHSSLPYFNLIFIHLPFFLSLCAFCHIQASVGRSSQSIHFSGLISYGISYVPNYGLYSVHYVL